MSKRRFIKDPLWGNIEIFEWEKELLNHFLLNRLHNVIQTSCAFRVYPGLRHSRFCHSIGVMHVATQMFVNLVINSDSQALEKLQIEREQADSAFGSRITIGHHISESVSSVTTCPEPWALLLASIRLAAMLHDIGHLPFSHVFESALQGFLARDLGVYDDPKLTTQQSDLNTLLPFKRKSGQTPGSDEAARSPIHEAVGRNFIHVLIQDLHRSMLSDDVSPSMQACLLAQVANDILHKDSMPISHSLIAGVLDADRIDFVRRDTMFSGLLTSSVDFNRLFSTYELAERVKGKGEYAPRPSLRAASEAEKLLWERFLEYKYVVAHHKVHLFDELLERLILALIVTKKLSPFLDHLCKLLRLELELSVTSVSEQRQLVILKQALLTEFDDPWLEHEIREGYIQSLDNGAGNGQIRFLFESLVEARDRFKSLFKRDDEYIEFITDKKLYDLPTAHLRQNAIKVARLVQVEKYAWETEISESLNQKAGKTGLSIIIGDSAGTLSDGFGRDKNAADFLRLPELRQFLGLKIESTMPFNAWFVDQGTLGPEGPSTEDWVKTQIAEKLTSRMGS